MADYNNNLIRKITSSGVVTTLAGSGATGKADGVGAAATFYNPIGLTIDAVGNLWMSDQFYGLIRRLTIATGKVTTLAGNGNYGLQNGLGRATTFADPSGLSADSYGNLYIADNGNNDIREMEIAGYSIAPALPGGLSFDSTTGIISGTPAATQAATVYTITAYNPGGTAATNLTITIVKSSDATLSNLVRAQVL